MHYDHVLLSAEEEIAFIELTATMPAEDFWPVCQLRMVHEEPTTVCRADEPDRAESLRYFVVATIGVLCLVGGGGLAACTTGVAAWCGMVALTLGMLVTLLAVVRSEAAPRSSFTAWIMRGRGPAGG
jgi:hypothetical protein